MSDSKYIYKAEEVVFDWKKLIDQTRAPIDIHLSCEDELVALIAKALEDK